MKYVMSIFGNVDFLVNDIFHAAYVLILCLPITPSIIGLGYVSFKP